MRYFSLFSGIGGFELGIHNAYVETVNRKKDRGGKATSKARGGKGYKKSKEVGTEGGLSCKHHHCDGLRQESLTCVGYSEIDKHAIKIYEKYFKHTNYGDIRKIKSRDLPDFDLLIGGFPCQSFSIAGKRKGFEDTRGTLFFEIARIIATKRPRLLLLENVKGLLSHEKGRTFGIILRTLDGLGYDLQWQVLNSKNFGVPQNRERVFIVGHLRGTPRPEVFPLSQNASEDIILPTITTRVTADSNGTYVGKRPAHKDLKYIGAVMSEKNKKWLDDGKQLSRNFPQGSRIYDARGIATTLASQAGGLGAKTGLYAVKGLQKIRRLTPMECERLQGFPDEWTLGASDTQRYKCLGNAVTVNVVQAIVEKLVFTRVKRK
jgi:DNA (cytosine-5)-methyltransferase 1